MSQPDLDPVRRSTAATLDEIQHAEKTLKDTGIDVRDEGEWMQLRDIVARIERKLKANQPEENAA